MTAQVSKLLLKWCHVQLPRSKSDHESVKIEIQSILLQRDARQQKVKFTGISEARVICQTDKVNSWLQGEKQKYAKNPERNPVQAVKAFPNSQAAVLVKFLQAVSLPPDMKLSRGDLPENMGEKTSTSCSRS